jgi:TonB family protein
MLLGLFSQRLVIPNNFQQLYNQEQQQLILEHEICHFDRNDIYWNLLAFILLALFWFHPLVWLAYFRYRRDQELSCDNIVLARKNMTSRINYSKALLVTAETSSAFAFAQLSFKKYGDKDIMFERIKQIQLDTKASLISLLTVSFLAVSLLSGLSYAGNVSNNEVDTKYRVPPQATVPLKPIHRVEPQYPEKAVVEKIEGGVVLKFDVDNDGYVKNVEVINGEPAYVFDRVAAAALRQWKYVSTGQYHKNQLVQLDFRLDKNSAYPDKNLIEKIQVTH